MLENHYQENRTLRTPMALLPYQQRWVADKAQVKVCEKSRRVGLSWGEAAEDSLLAASAGGMDVWYIGYNKDMAREFIEDCADWSRFYNLAATSLEEFVFADDEDKNIHAFRIAYASGFKIVALSSRPSNLRGKQGKVVIDEAAFHDDLDGLIKAAMALLMWGGRVVIISTHGGEDNHFCEIIGDIRAGKRRYSLHRITFDDALAEGLYERICLRLGRQWSQGAQDAWRQSIVDAYGEHADEELFCIPSKGSGVYLPRALIQSCMEDDIPVLRWAVKPEFAQLPALVRQMAASVWCEEHLAELLDHLSPAAPCVFGEDFGRTGDLTVIWPMQEIPGIRWRVPFLVELRGVPYHQQEQILFYTCDRLPCLRGGALDARGNGNYLSEVAMQRYGAYRIHQVALSQAWYLENMPPYKAAYEDRSIVIPKDGDILDDHRAIRMEKGIAKVPENYRGKGRDGLQRHGDSGIAGALAWYAATKIEGGPIEYRSTGKKRATAGLDRFMEG